LPPAASNMSTMRPLAHDASMATARSGTRIATKSSPACELTRHQARDRQ
jgi:hypothetical protein